jgi:hypothetical protein
MNNLKKSHALGMLWILVLAACGGGTGSGGTASSPPATAVATAEGLWSGGTSSSSTVTAIVLDNDTYWILYSVPHVSALMAGFVQGTATSLNGSFSSSDAIDFNVAGQGINSATVSATYAVKQSFNGSVTYPSLSQTSTFTSSYTADYDQVPSRSAISGTYTGIASVLGNNELTTIAISSQGVVVGTGTGGCTFLGTAVPRSRGNIYDLSVVFGGGACSNGTSAVTGIGYLDSGAKRLYVAALSKSRNDGLIFVGIKP